jgi:hypothetical protein
MTDAEDEQQFTTKTELLRWNETLKHHASWCNTISGGILSAGSFRRLWHSWHIATL